MRSLPKIIMYFTAKVDSPCKNQMQENIIGMFIHDEYFNWNQMEYQE